MKLFDKEWRRLMRLRRLSRKLYRPHPISSSLQLIRAGRKEDKGIEALYNFMASDEYVSDVIQKRKLTKEDVNRLFIAIVSMGGGQIVKDGFYLPVLILTHHLTLPLAIEGMKTHDEALETISQCLDFWD